LQAIEAKLSDAGLEILAISPDRPAKLRESVAEHDLDYTLLSDSPMKAARALGVAFALSAEVREKYAEHGLDLVEATGETHGLLPVPSVFLIDADGTIRFVHADPDHTRRLDPQVVLAVARSLGAD
jgi:peroxiredoxin